MQDYFTYLPLAEDSLVWGAAVTSTGVVTTPAGVDYPAREAGHPADHLFSWDTGRVLDCWQVILIREGRGWFESAPTGLRAVGKGSVFFVFPGVWHRYAPDRDVGWVESWVEMVGAVPDQLWRSQILDPGRAVCHLGEQPELTEAVDRCHLLAQNRPPGYAAQLAAAALLVMAHVVALRDFPGGATSRMGGVVQRAMNLLIERCGQPFQIRNLARELGVCESHLRRAFKAHTGLSPKQYSADLRLRRVRGFLQSTSLTIAQIADRMGYSSPFHLSSEFKKRYGCSPRAWRQRYVEIGKDGPQ